MSDKSTPRRKYTLELNIHGDTWKDVMNELDWITEHIHQHGEQCDSGGGGPDSGHTVMVIKDPQMTHEKYHTEVKAWMEERDKNKESG